MDKLDQLAPGLQPGTTEQITRRSRGSWIRPRLEREDCGRDRTVGPTNQSSSVARPKSCPATRGAARARKHALSGCEASLAGAIKRETPGTTGHTSSISLPAADVLLQSESFGSAANI